MRNIIFMLALALAGCGFLPLKNHLVIHVNDNDYYPNHSIRYKSIPHTWECDGAVDHYGIIKKPAQYPSKYIFISDCHMDPDDYIPETITIEYTPWLTDDEQKAKGLFPKSPYLIKDGNVLGDDEAAILYNETVLSKKMDDDVDKIPESQWHKIVLHPQELVKKYKGVTPDGEGMRSAGKEIAYNITLNKDGTYKVEDSVSWRTPISHNWAN